VSGLSKVAMVIFIGFVLDGIREVRMYDNGRNIEIRV
jgi:hypothetical protein